MGEQGPEVGWVSREERWAENGGGWGRQTGKRGEWASRVSGQAGTRGQWVNRTRGGADKPGPEGGWVSKDQRVGEPG